jgi:hypothetical protein
MPVHPYEPQELDGGRRVTRVDLTGQAVDGPRGQCPDLVDRIGERQLAGLVERAAEVITLPPAPQRRPADAQLLGNLADLLAQHQEHDRRPLPVGQPQQLWDVRELRNKVRTCCGARRCIRALHRGASCSGRRSCVGKIIFAMLHPGTSWSRRAGCTRKITLRMFHLGTSWPGGRRCAGKTTFGMLHRGPSWSSRSSRMERMTLPMFHFDVLWSGYRSRQGKMIFRMLHFGPSWSRRTACSTKMILRMLHFGPFFSTVLFVDLRVSLWAAGAWFGGHGTLGGWEDSGIQISDFRLGDREACLQTHADAFIVRTSATLAPGAV